MKKYIRSTSSEELKRKLDLQIKKERTADLVGPVIERISDAYFDETGFKLTVMKYYYREDLDAVLIEFAQYCEYGLGRLIGYTNPGRAKPSDPAMISLDASDDEIYDYVDRLVERLTERIQKTFDSWITLIEFDGKDESVLDSESVIDYIVRSSNCDKSHAANFVRSLLNSGEVVNKLWDYVAEDDEGYYLVYENGDEVHRGKLYSRRKNI